jgi:hypothetical protein
MAYFADDGGDILAMDTSTGAAKTLVQNAGSPTSCAAAEGWLYYVLDNTLFRVSTGGGEPDKLTDGVSAFCIDGGKMYAAFCDYDAAESETGKCHLAYASAPYTKFKEISGTSAERATIGTVIKIGDTIYVL